MTTSTAGTRFCEFIQFNDFIVELNEFRFDHNKASMKVSQKSVKKWLYSLLKLSFLKIGIPVQYFGEIEPDLKYFNLFVGRPDGLES